MKAAVRYTYCSPNDLAIREMPIPTPGSHEVLVKVKATSISRTDCAVLTGKPWLMRLFTGLWKPAMPVTGTDFSGIIVSKGSEVTQFDIGDSVFGFFDQGLSSHAEYVAVSVKKAVFRKPVTQTYEQAAASTEGAHYAFYFMNDLALNPGTQVLINGGTGAVGNAALQILKHFNAIVTVTCETDFINVLKQQGADHVIDYTREDFTQINKRFDYVFDAVGKSSFAKCRRLLKPRGIYLSSEPGRYWQNPLLALLAPLMPGKKVKFPVPYSITRSLSFINELTLNGQFKPLIDRRYKLEEISEAFDYVMSGQKKGNVIIVVD